MDLVCVILFLVMYYIRPQEWGSIFSTIHFVQLVMIAAIGTLFFRERSLRLGDLFKTPHDWMIFAFIAWVTISSGNIRETFGDMKSLLLFYIVIVQTLTTIPRIKTFVGWWTFLIIAIAGLAIASQHGFDPLGSKDLTDNTMKGRLALNLSIFRNPNALGHNVVPAIPMLFFFLFWRRPIFMKEVAIFFMIVPLYCIYLTVSKGSFLCGSAVLVATLTFGRPKSVQVLIVVFALMVGAGALYKLPRMTELEKSKTDGAIQGRVAAFTHGLKMIQTQKFGIGYHNWMTSFFRTHGYGKAAHSSYVQIGAETGYVGFFLFLGILYCCLRTLVSARTQTDDEERIRRILFVLVVSYMISSWMVDFGYRPTFFMFAAATAAFHRHLYGLNRPEEENESVALPGQPVLPAWRARLLPQPANALASAATPAPAVANAPATVMALPATTPLRSLNAAPPFAKAAPDEAAEAEQPRQKPTWNSIGLFDLAVMLAMTKGAVIFWGYIKNRM